MRKFKSVGGRVKFKLSQLQTEYHKKLIIKNLEKYYQYEYEKRPYKDNESFFVYGLEKYITGLPMIIWLYEAGERGYFTKVPHIFFQKDKSDNRNFFHSYMMSISDNPQILTKKLKPAKKFITELKMSDIKEVQNWVINHYAYLMKLWKLEMETDEFYDILENELKDKT